MTFRDASGNILSKTELLALTTAVPDPDDQFKLTAKVYQTYPLSGEGTFEAGKRLLYKPGTVLTQSQIDAMYPTGTATSISPATGAAAGNTAVTITGTNLDGVETVTFGGTAATQVKVESPTKVTCRTPAHAAGAVTVVIGDDAAAISKPTFYTYT